MKLIKDGKVGFIMRKRLLCNELRVNANAIIEKGKRLGKDSVQRLSALCG